jgi:hypothetical protein
MTRRWLALALVLCALPASGDDAAMSPAAIDTLAMTDAFPSRTQVDFAFGDQSALDQLLAAINDPGQDLLLQIRAIRMLPQYCPPVPDDPDHPCDTGTVHDTLAKLVGDYARRTSSGALAPADLLRLRAAIEALGATHSGLASDVALLTTTATPLLAHPSRDVRVTAVRALRALCDPKCDQTLCESEFSTLRTLHGSENSPQVVRAIENALNDLAQCSP